MLQKAFSANLNKILFVSVLLLAVLAIPLPAEEDQWHSLGLGGKRTVSFSMSAVNPDVIYAGTMGYGVFFTVDGGINWTQANVGLTWVNMKVIAVDPKDPDIIFAGTENTDHGLFRTINGGGYWVPANTGINAPWITDIAIHPSIPGVVYLGTHDDGVYKTTDNGDTWFRINNGLFAYKINTIDMDPQHPDTLYIGYGGEEFQGIYKTTDGGEHWTEQCNGLPFIEPGKYVASLAIFPGDPRIIYASIWGSTGIYLSIDGGVSWNLTTSWIDIYDETHFPALLVHPTDPATVFLGNRVTGMYRSVDWGHNWLPFNNGLGSPFINDLKIHPLRPDVLLAGTGNYFYDGGIFAGSFASPPPGIIRQPQSAIIASGEQVTLTVDVSGAGPFQYQWFEGERGDTAKPIQGAIQNTLQTPAITTTTAFWVQVGGPYGTVNSETAWVKVATQEYRLYCTHVVESDYWWTRLSVSNIGEEDTPLLLELFDPAGQLVETRSIARLRPDYPWADNVVNLFSPEALAGDRWLRITAACEVVGVLEFGTRDHQSAASIPMFRSGMRKLIYPYVVITADWYTGITLVNIEDQPATITLEAFSEAGVLLDTLNLTLQPNEKYIRLVSLVFNPAVDPMTIRSIRATSNQELIGFELFGNFNPAFAGAAGLPPFSLDEDKDAADTSTIYYNEIPDPSYFYTGVTVSNMGLQPAGLTAEAFDKSGARLAEYAWPTPIQPMEQVTRKVWDFFGGTAYPNAAYIRFSSPEQLMGFELFLTDFSITAPFQLDGLTGVQPATGNLFFPVVKMGPHWDSLLRLTNPETTSSRVNIVIFDTFYGEVHTYSKNLPAGQSESYNLDSLYSYVEGDLVWCWVEVPAGKRLIGDLVLKSRDATLMESYMGLRR